MDKSVSKLISTSINPFQAHIYYNAYMIKSVYFGCGIVELSDKQEEELKRLYEEPLLVKLGLSRKFPRVVLYSRKSALGVGIMALNTILAMLKAKLYLGNIRRKGETHKAIELQEELMTVEAGQDIKIGSSTVERYWHRTWVDEVHDLFSCRDIILKVEEKHTITKNKTLMEYAVEYINSSGRKHEELW